MRTKALVMAGGAGSRMSRSGVHTPKPLVQVAGRPLIEWNLLALRRHGVDEVVVSVSEEAASIRAWVRAQGLPELVETAPLGNIGAAGELLASCERLLVVFADNLTDLDLGALLEAHRGALTLATHQHPVPVDYGVLELSGQRVTAYREKPTLQVTVSSGLYVLGPPAMQAIAARTAADEAGQRGRCGATDMVRDVLEAGHEVGSFAHQARWVDVNDARKLGEAEELLRGWS